MSRLSEKRRYLLRALKLLLLLFAALSSELFAQEEKKSPEEFGSDVVDSVLLLDSSASMLLSDPNRLRDGGAKLFSQFLSGDDRVSVISFAEGAQLIRPLSNFEKDNGARLGRQISSIGNTGQYTDLLAGLERACGELIKSGRPNVSKVVVLFSDGKMDPSPAKGTPETLTTKLLFNTIPDCRENGIRIHTLAFSSNADQDLLRKIAENSEGVGWFAQTAEKIHEAFAELFLVVKKPQVVPLTPKGFKIDENVNEATFYVNNLSEDNITIQSPTGKLFSKELVDPRVKWFSSQKFEVVTIRDPEVGNWRILGVPSSDVFATVLTNLKLKSDWPPSIVAGEEVVLQVRLEEEEKPVILPNMSNEILFKFDVLPTDKVSEPVVEDLLRDNGKDGDVKANDGIFSKAILLEQAGEYRIDLEAKAPTFIRRQRIPFRVRPRLVELSIVKVAIQDLNGVGAARDREFLRVELSSEVTSLKKINTKLIAVDDKRRRFEIPLVKAAGNTLRYEAPVANLPHDGNYQLQATVSGQDRRKKRVVGKSRVVKYKKVSVELDEGDGELQVIEVKEKEPEKPQSPLLAIIILIVLQSGVGGGLFVLLKKSQAKISITIPKYQPSEALLANLEALEQKAAETSVDLEDERFSEGYDAPPPPTFSSNLANLEDTAAAPAEDAPAEAADEPESGEEELEDESPQEEEEEEL